jgi:heme-degrading monooxygenase HmoA
MVGVKLEGSRKKLKPTMNARFKGRDSMLSHIHGMRGTHVYRSKMDKLHR